MRLLTMNCTATKTTYRYSLCRCIVIYNYILYTELMLFDVTAIIQSEANCFCVCVFTTDCFE